MSHMHWDHIMGFPFFGPAYVPKNKLFIYGCHDELEFAFRRQQEPPSFPVPFSALGADIQFVKLAPGRQQEIRGLKVTPQVQRHSGDSYGFRFEHGGKNWVFYEDYSYRKKRASICCAEVSSDGSLISPTVCLESPDRHYSYPHVFRAGNDIYMVPESYDSERVDLFRCEEFPNKWVRARTLFEGRFVDTTIWQHDGVWWMMTTRAEPDPRAGCLLLYYSESLTGEWRFHPSNPISTDARNNRGAGRVFYEGDRLIRPSQSRCPIYGYSFSLNEITTLSPEQYAERVLTTVTPEFWKGYCSVHTYNRTGDFEWIDGARMTPLKDVVSAKSGQSREQE